MAEQTISKPAITDGSVAEEITLRTIAFSLGWKFHRHWLSDTGTIVFSGSNDLAPGSFTDDSLVMVGSRGFVKLVSRGDPVPGKEGQLFIYLGYHAQELSLNDRDQAAFLAMFKPCPSRELLRQCEMQSVNPPTTGLFIYAGGSIRKIATVGEVSPDDSALIFSNLSYPTLNNRGEVLFSATLSFADRPLEPGQLGIFRYNSSRIEKIVKAGDATPLGGTFKFDMKDPRHGFSLWGGVLAVEDDGAILFSDRTSTGLDALFSYSNSRKIGIPTCGYVTGPMSVSSAGDALLSVDANNACTGSSYLLWNRGGSLEWIPILRGQPTPTGGTFSGVYIGEYPQLGGRDAILFMDGIQGGDTQGGYFQYQAGSIKKLVASKDSAPVYTGGDFEIFREEKRGDYTILVPPSTRFAFNEWNMLAFTSEISGTPRLFGLFLANGASFSPIALLGDRAPQAEDQRFANLPSGWIGGGGAYDTEDRILLNNSGELLFRSQLCCGTWDQGLFLASPFSLKIPNGGFELGEEAKYPEGWSIAWSNSGGGQAVRFESGETSVFSGTSCLRLQTDLGGGSTFVLSDPIPANSQATYLVSCRLRYNLSASVDRAYFTAIQYDHQGSELGIDEFQGRQGDSLWNWETRRINIRTRKEAAFIRIRFGLKSTEAATLDVDAVR